MFRYMYANILASECRFILIPVNIVGVMGAGLAKEAAETFPTQCEKYYTDCKEKKVQTGQVTFAAPLVFFPTKRHWKDPSRLEWVVEGLKAFKAAVGPGGAQNNRGVAIPALGCGLGGLAWADVREVIETLMENFHGLVEIYPPQTKKNLVR